MNERTSTPQTGGVDEIGRIETRGVDYVPPEERHSPPNELAAVFFGAQMCLGIIVLGSLPVLFGLGWWASFWAITVGTLVGTAFFGPMALLGPRTGTNSAVSSGASFGVVGRLIPSLVVVVIAVGFYALAVWTGAQAIVAGANRLFDMPIGDLQLAIAYAVIGAITVLVALVGHATVVAAAKVLAPLLALLLVIGIIIKLPDFHADYAGGDYLLGGFWSTWLLAMVTAAGLPLSYAPFVNDYARYLPANQARRGAWMASIGVFVGCWFALIFAAYFTTMFPDLSVDFVFGLVDASPTWFAIPLIVVGLLGGCGQGAVALYGSGLITSALLPQLDRVKATMAISAIGLALVYLGSLVWDSVSSVSAFITLLIVVTAPWLVISVLGHLAVRGRYAPLDLQYQSHNGARSIYWYNGGWNLFAIAAWVPSVIVGLMLANTPPVLEGPWRNVAGGVDLSFVSASLLAFLIYGTFLLASRERVVATPSRTGGYRAAPSAAAHSEAINPPTSGIEGSDIHERS